MYECFFQMCKANIYKLCKNSLTMAQISVTSMSSKGQVVIPAEMRADLKEGEKIVVIRHHDQIILKKADKFDKNLAEDLEFARRTEEAWKEIKQGKGVSMSVEDFLKEIKTW